MPCGQAQHVFTPGHVGHDGDAPAAGATQYLIESRPQLFLMPAGDDDIGPGFHQSARHGLAEPLAAAGHQRYLVCQLKEVVSH